jgi:hypothetical protein
MPNELKDYKKGGYLMKKSSFRRVKICLVMALLMSVSGCGYNEYLIKGGKPHLNATQTVTRYESTNYDVLGIVTAEGYSRCILGIVIEGSEGEALLWDAARGHFGNKVTGVKDINVSYEYQSVLPPVFCEIRTTYVGTAVHEK